MHSRTPGGGDDEWAHPFVREKDGRIAEAYIANGGAGCFANRIDELAKAAVRLQAEGYALKSRCKGTVGKYPQLPDGSTVHMSDIMMQMIASKIDAGLKTPDAVEASFCELPGELVALALSVSEPDSITWSRINMPLFLGFAPHGIYLASTPQAFLPDVENVIAMPVCAGGRVTANGYTVSRYKNAPARVATVNASLVIKAYTVIEGALKTGACTFPQLTHLVNPLFGEGDCCERNALVYYVLASLEKENRLIIYRERVKGLKEGLYAPLLKAQLR